MYKCTIYFFTDPKGSRNHKFPEFAPSFASDSVELREHNRRRRKGDVEDCASEDRPKLARRWDAKMGGYDFASPKDEEGVMNTLKQPKSGGSRESFIIFVVVCCGILATLSFNTFIEPVSPQKEQSVRPKAEESKSMSPKKKSKPMALTDIPLATGHEPLEKLFVQSGCAVCHTIPGIGPAKGREGPTLVLGTNGPLRLADPNYQGTAESVREYIQESILNPGAYIVPGYSDRVMPRWYGKRLNAKSLDRIATYLAGLKN